MLKGASPTLTESVEHAPSTEHISIFAVNRIIRAIEEEGGLAEIDFVSKCILYFIGDRDEAGQKVTPANLINCKDFGTAPTVYVRLSKLSATGWIDSGIDPLDGRSKLLKLTRKSRRLFLKMSKRLRRVYLNQNIA